MAETAEVMLDMGVGMETEEGLAIIERVDAVTDIYEMAGSRLRFAGQRVVETGSFHRLDGVEVFAALRGWILFLKETRASNWAVSGATLDEAVEAIHERDIAERVRSSLQDKGVLKFDPSVATG